MFNFFFLVFLSFFHLFLQQRHDYFQVVETSTPDDVGGDACIGANAFDSTSKQLTSIGTEMKHWQNYADEDDEEVSLINHSAVQGAFKKYKPIIAPTIIRANYHPLSTQQQDNAATSSTFVAVDEDGEQENYLTSEKTHFSPIIRDGHTFSVDNNWDEVEWNRSPGGGRYHNNKRYQVWETHDDLFFNETLNINAMESEVAAEKEFQVKYLVKSENEKGCQTEESELMRLSRSYLEINEEYCRRKIYDEYFRGATENNTWRTLNNGNEDSNEYSFFSVNRVKDKPPCQNVLPSSNSSSSSICTITSTYDAAAVEDPFESWRNLNADQDHKHNCGHRLWEQCIKCARNEEDSFIEKPVPANRLLKDELKLDGDEIMNVIQNLYISSDLCEDDEEKEDEGFDGFDINHVMNIISMDDGMDMIEEDEEDSKFYEEINTKSTLENAMFPLTNDQAALAIMQNKRRVDEEQCANFFKWLQNAHNCMAGSTTITTADMNNNEYSSLCEIHHSANNRKRRHSTCQNLMEKRRFESQEGFMTYLNLGGQTPLCDFNAENLIFETAKMLKMNIDKILLISNEPGMSMGGFFPHYMQNDGNYYRNNLQQQQHALVKHLDSSRPLTR